jgi:hypothetical protein
MLLVLLLGLAGCTSGGGEGQATAPSAPSPQVERQALANLLALYPEAVVAEDSDRLQALLAPEAVLMPAQPTAVPRQDPSGAFADLTTFQATLRTTFQHTAVTALAIPPETVVLAPDQSQVTFLEVESTYAITGLQAPPVLVALDPATGQGTALAQTDMPTQAEAMAFTADGRLVVAGSDANLYEINPVTGASRLIGPTGVEAVSGLSLRGFPQR